MVNVYNPDGTVSYREPPYTEEEEAELWELLSHPPIAIAHGPRAARSTTEATTEPTTETPQAE